MINYFFETIFLEQFLSSEFTIGFEFEGFTKSDSVNYNNVQNFMTSYFSEGPGTFKGDSSIESDSNDQETFEWASPIFKVNSGNYSRIITFLEKLTNEYASTNNSCGFHTHIGFPVDKDYGFNIFWIILNLALEKDHTQSMKMLAALSRYKGIAMHNTGYASIDFLFDLKSGLERIIFEKDDSTLESKTYYKDKLMDRIKEFYSSEKYRLFRIHPKTATMEWRGPRAEAIFNFSMEAGKVPRNTIRDFFTQKLHPFILWISKMLSKESIEFEGLYIDKKDLYKELQAYGSPVDKDKPKDGGMFHPMMTREMKRDVIKKFPWLGPHKTTYTSALIVDYNGKPVFIMGAWKNGIFKDGYFTGHYFSGTFENGNMGTLPKEIETSLKQKYPREMREYETGTNVENSSISNGKFNEVNFTRTEIKDGIFRDSQVRECDVSKGNFNESRITNTSIENGDFNNCDMNECDIDFASIIFSRETGSGWKTINNCLIKEAKAIDIKFDQCNIVSGKYENSSFNNSHITGNYKNCRVDKTTFINGIFDGGEFTKSSFQSGTFKNGTFDEQSRFNNGIFLGGKFNGHFFNGEFHDNEETVWNGKWYGGTIKKNGEEIKDKDPRGGQALPNPDKRIIYFLNQYLKKSDIEKYRLAEADYGISLNINDPNFLPKRDKVIAGDVYRNSGGKNYCQICEGDGIKNGTECNRCLGTGMKSNDLAPCICHHKKQDENGSDLKPSKNCLYCYGTGFMLYIGCPTCDSDGYKYDHEKDERIICKRCEDGKIPLETIELSDYTIGGDASQGKRRVPNMGAFDNVNKILQTVKDRYNGKVEKINVKSLERGLNSGNNNNNNNNNNNDDDDSNDQECGRCNGYGTVEDDDGQEENCPECDGRGVL